MKKGVFYDIPEKYKYSVAFESIIKPLNQQESEKYISLAAQKDLKKYLPKGFNLEEKVDCLAIAGQAFNVNKLNLNDDGVNNETAARIVELFPLSYIDKFHRRNDILGVILNASFIDSETNKELTKEEVKDYKNPYTCVIGGIVWKLSDPKLAEAIEESNNVDSKYYGKLYFSWELGFSDIQIIELPKGQTDFTQGNVISDTNKIKEYEKYLKANGGSGQLDNGNKIGRIIVGDCIPLGVGIVENPAGQLSPIISKAENQDKQDETIEASNNFAKGGIVLEQKIPCILDHGDYILKKEIVEKFGTHFLDILNNPKQNFTSKENSVNANINNNEIQIMEKINSIQDITDENIKKISKASIYTDFINEEIKKANEQYKEEQKKSETTAKSLTDTQEELKKVKSELDTINQKVAKQEAEAKFNQRMTYFDDTYELSQEERQAIAGRVKDVSDEDFNKVKSEYELLLKDKNKETVAAKKKELEKKNDKKNDKEPDKDGDDKKKETKASVENPEVVIDEALKNGKETNKPLPNSTTLDQTFADKFAEAFKVENCIKISK